MAQAQAESISLKISDGSSMGAFLARPESAGSHPGILVFQEAYGVNHHIREVTMRLAREGYIALAPELFHRTAPGFEGSYGDFQAVMPHIRALTDAGLEADVRAAHDAVAAQPGIETGKIACIGFCMGGRVSFLADSVLPVAAAISYYGGGIAPSQMGPGLLGRAARLHAPILMFWGGLDKHIGPDQHRAVVDALRAAGKPYVNVEFSGADHGFNCDERASYNATAAKQAWALSLDFLKACLGR
ncbi:MAG TPA: dienelactone hydrolase family protein [Candidatus Acidoferrales bacterium]|nr:dienelactone hydrolase family protein [Candidatus Acidoferrales bacterium]